MRHAGPAIMLVAAVTLGGAAYAQQPPGEIPGRGIERGVETEAQARADAGGEGPIVGSGAAVEWVGLPLAAIDGTEVGTVTEVRTTSSGAVTEVRAEVGGILGLFTRKVAIPAERIVLEQDGALIAEMSAEEIRRAPEVSG